MKRRLKEIASLVGGELVGDPNLEIKGVANLKDAKSGDLTFALEEKFIKEAAASDAAAVITPRTAQIKEKAIIRVANPRLAMAKILSLFAPQPTLPRGVHKTAVLGRDVKIGKDVSIQAFVILADGATVGNRVILYPGVYIGSEVSIGDDTIIYPNVSIYDRVSIGKRVIIHGGTVIGSDGYGFVPVAGKYQKIPQIGKVIIEDDVEIGANVTVARATLGSTWIKRGTKIDNLVHIAHNCVIGEDCAITSLAAFAGSVTLENHVSVGGQAGFAGHIRVGEGTVVMARSGVTKDIPPHSVISGFPAQDHKKELEIEALIRRVAKLEKSSK